MSGPAVSTQNGHKILGEGAEKARALALSVLEIVRRAVGISR
jgi:hypothetical protein